MNTKNFTSKLVGAGVGLLLAGIMPMAAMAQTTNPSPFVSSMSPSSRVAGDSSFTLFVTGSNFVPNSVILFNGIAQPTTYNSANQLSAVIPAANVSMTGQHAVSVRNPLPGGGTSNAILFTVGPITTTPTLPDTGFGPVSKDNNLMVALLALGTLLSVGVVIGKRAWLTR